MFSVEYVVDRWLSPSGRAVNTVLLLGYNILIYPVLTSVLPLSTPPKGGH